MRAAIALQALVAALALPTAGARTPSPSFDAAVRAYDGQRWHEAFDMLAELADHGDGAAARLALMMATHGTRLFGGHFEATPERRRHWLALAGDTPAD